MESSITGGSLLWSCLAPMGHIVEEREELELGLMLEGVDKKCLTQMDSLVLAAWSYCLSDMRKPPEYEVEQEAVYIFFERCDCHKLTF